MALKMSEAQAYMEEGRQARRDEVVEFPYKETTSEAFWWAKGWAAEHRILEREERVSEK